MCVKLPFVNNRNAISYLYYTCLILSQKRTKEEFLYSFYFPQNPLHRNMIPRRPKVKDLWSLLLCCFLHGVMWTLGLNAQSQGFLKQMSEEHFSSYADYSWTCVLTWPCQPAMERYTCNIMGISFSTKWFIGPKAFILLQTNSQ